MEIHAPDAPHALLRLPADGPPLTPAAARDAIGEALGCGADTVVVPVGRLDPSFLDLASGVAGDIVQAFATYEMRLVVVGELPSDALDSRSFMAFAREANRGTQTWFLRSDDELDTRLAAGT